MREKTIKHMKEKKNKSEKRHFYCVSPCSEIEVEKTQIKNKIWVIIKNKHCSWKK